MSAPPGWALLALLAVLALLALAALALLAYRRLLVREGVQMREVGRDEFEFRTPLGHARAALVMHEEHGRVYEVHWALRREPMRVTHTPPALHLLRTHVAREIERRLTAR